MTKKEEAIKKVSFSGLLEEIKQRSVVIDIWQMQKWCNMLGQSGVNSKKQVREEMEQYLKGVEHE